MYESHFGFSGPPFQLSPDPGFYFDSRGHNHALAYLKFGVYQGEGFIVVTGEIGAGKTTLVRTLIDSLQSQEVVAAQVVSTQLESGDLLRSIITAFGIPPQGGGKADLIASIEAFLTSLAASGRRALLLVDEAQNLPPAAVEELRMLSNFQLGNRALLQSFLVGQPELRQILKSGSMEQFRQRVIASCHLGPLEEAETRAYIEHRLHRVRWSGNPAFEDAAFERIHHHTRGVPRRINLLCNRLLLAAFLGGQDVIGAPEVDVVATDFLREIGEGASVGSKPAGEPATAAPVPLAAVPAGKAQLPVLDDAQPDVVRKLHAPGTTLRQPLLCLVDSPQGYLKAAALAKGLGEQPGLPVLVVVNPGPESAVALSSELAAVVSPPAMEVHLGAAAGRFAESAAVAQVRFDALLNELSPRALLTLADGDGAFACSLVAAKAGVPVLRLEADVPLEEPETQADLNSVLLNRIAELFYVGSILSHYTLQRKGVAADRVRGVGHLLDNVVHMLLPHAAAASSTLARAGADGLADTGFGVITEQFDADLRSEEQFAAQVEALCLMSSVLPLVWPVQQHTLLALRNRKLQKQLAKARIALVSQTSYLELLGLLRAARAAVLGPDMAWAGEVQALGVPALCLVSGDTQSPGIGTGSSIRTLRHGGQALKELEALIAHPRDDDSIAYWDGGAAHRIASHLRGWLRRRGPQGAPATEHSEMALP
ncbi:MAG: XrtA/PEP-CTERM system-associated ATPase [Pseudomonadota bacterium]